MTISAQQQREYQREYQRGRKAADFGYGRGDGAPIEWQRGYDDRMAERAADMTTSTAHANLRTQVAAEIEHADSFQAKPTPRYTTSMIEGHETRWAIELDGVSIGEIRRYSSSYRPVYDLAARIVDLLNQHGEG